MIDESARVWRMSRLATDGTAEPASQDQIFRRERGQGKIHVPCSADLEQDRQPYLVDLYPAIRNSCCGSSAERSIAIDSDRYLTTRKTMQNPTGKAKVHRPP